MSEPPTDFAPVDASRPKAVAPPAEIERCRLIDGAAGDGAWQMAVDEVLLASAAAGQGCSLRFYRWSRPTLSLGYFQRHLERAEHAASRDCPLVRRQTGGGAIVHDRETTYSLAVPAAHPLAGDPAALYDAVHGALVAALGDFGVEAHRAAAAPQKRAEREPFLCFQRISPCDVVLGSSKVCGSAQRRRRGAVLQHGSLLWSASPCAPELPGALDLCGRAISEGELLAAWRQGLAKILRLFCEPAGLSPGEIEAARALTHEKYTAPWWNDRR